MVASFFSRLKRNIKASSNWLSFLSGLSLVFAYAPYNQWWLPFVTLPIFINQLINDNGLRTGKLSFLFGLGWFASGISWVHVSIAEFGGLPLAVSLALMLLLCIYLALFPALTGLLTAKLSRYLSLKNKKAAPESPLINIWLFLPLWIFTEWLRGFVLTGFPWLSLGYSQIDSPLRSLGPIIGEIGITFVLLALTICITQVYQTLKQRSDQKLSILRANIAIISCLCVLVIFSANYNSITPTGEIKKVALVQGNIAQQLKWQPEQEWPTMLKYLDLTRKNYDAELVVWPESAIPAIEPLAGEYLDMVNQAAAMNNTAIVTGILNYNIEAKQYFNALIVLGKKRADDDEGSYYYPNNNRFYKHHLLPIGEFVPFQELLRPIAPLFNLPQSSFTRGDYVQPNLLAQGLHIAPLICFEIAFPEQLAANFTHSTDILLTVSNDAWFGSSHGPHQHMDIARMRALEFGRPILRSTNTGITAVVDHQGQYVERLPQFEEGVLRAEVALVEGRTPFSLYQRYPTFIASFLIFVFIYLKRQKQKNKNL